jgi:phosphoglycerate kinase
MAYLLESQIKSWNLEGKRVFVRADLNVPIHDGIITNDYRLRKVTQTLKLIIRHGGSIILASHLGRPRNTETQYSLQQLVPWFQQNGFTITFAKSPEQAEPLTKSMASGTILLLENLRFFPGEKSNDAHFAQTLAHLADYYVDDAFATLHRIESSITLVPRYFDESKRTIGLLVEHELRMLNRLLISPIKPFVLIIGGCKIRDKIQLIEHLVPHVDAILLCPAIAFSFLKAIGISVGKSLVDLESTSLCRSILAHAQQHNCKVMLPLDLQVAEQSLDGSLSIVDIQKIPKTSVGISIGPKTIEFYSQEIAQAKTIFYNGLMGFQERPETLQGMHTILQAMTTSRAFTAIGGGDTVGAAETLGLADSLSFCSTGGSATLSYLSGQPLPGLEALITP